MGLRAFGHVSPALLALGDTETGDLQAVSWTLGPQHFLCLNFPHQVDELRVGIRTGFQDLIGK